MTVETDKPPAGVDEPDAAADPEAATTAADAPPAPSEPPAEPSAGSEVGRLRWVRGGVLALVGALIPFFFMASDRRWSMSVPLGALGCALSVFGVLDLLRTFDDPKDEVAAQPDGSRFGARVAEMAAAGAALFLSLRLAVSGVLPQPIPSAALLVTGTFLWLVVAVYRAGRELGAWQDEAGVDRQLWQRHGFWLVVITTLLYLPMLGSYSLSDPWETHYGEVAREMIARDDWISTWWAQEGWFWSKPVLDFWMQAVFFKALGVRAMPDQMLAAVAEGRFPQPEWAARLPVFLLTLLGVYLLYKGAAKAFGRRAGLIGGIVLLTMPYWYFVAHQTMTDMPYVAPLSAAMGLFLLAFHTDPDAEVKRYELVVGPYTLRIGLHHLVLGAIALVVLPQVLYLVSRNLTLHLEGAARGFRPHLDEFWSGSGGGNCGLPGNEACRRMEPVNKTFQPWMTGALWAFVGGALLWINRSERRLSRLYFIAGWFFVAISALGKGAPGLVLPIFIVGVYIGATRRWKDLTRVELASMALIVACVTLPWYVQMYLRHGQQFTDRLLFHDMYKRAFVHVHDTNSGDDVSFRYYIWQLGYGLFPWTGLAAAGVVWWARRKNDVSDPRGDGGSLFALWLVTAFSMFTITLTKFHHYVLPVVPPTAMLLGVMLDRTIRSEELPSGRRLFGYLAALAASAALAVYGCFRLFPGSLTGRTIDGKLPPPALVPLGVSCIAIAIAIAALTIRHFRKSASAPSALEPSEKYDAVMLGAVGLASAFVVGLAGRDLFTTNPGDIDGQARLMHLFTYNYRRPWPPTLQFEAVLTGFTIVCAALCALLVIRRIRTHASVLLLAASLAWAVWGVDVYLVKSAPHWGQRETIMAYYADREGPHQPLVAYQMNWKGENFYAGNRIPAFVSSGQKFKDWIEEQKKNGITTIYFTTEHGRVGSLKGEIGAHKTFDVLTTPELNNKFFLGRVRF